MKNIFLIILALLLIPNVFFLVLQLSREQENIVKWNSQIGEDGLWVNPKHPAVREINTTRSYSGIVTLFTEDYSQWKLSDLEIISGGSENRGFNLIEITGDTNNTKFFLRPSDKEVDEYLSSLLIELGNDGFLVSDARENVFNILRKELTKDEFTQQIRLGKFVDIFVSRGFNSDELDIISIAIRQ